MTLCWWCCHEIHDKEFHLPYKYDELRRKFYTQGYFCSWGCAKAFAIDKYGLTKGGQMCELLCLMKKQQTGAISSIVKAPDRYSLKVFGGTLTIHEFRNISADNYPIVTFANEVHNKQEVTTQLFVKKSTQDTQEEKLDKINNSSNNNETLKLKREKPLKRDSSSLEKSLGLIRKKK